MTTFVHPDFPVEHKGAERAAGLAQALRKLVQRGRDAVRAYREHSHSASEDHKLWEMALADARVMADISRAMKVGAPSKVAFY